MADHNNIPLSDSFKEIIIDFGDICRFCLTETKNGISVNEKFSSEWSKEMESESVCNFISKLRIVEVNSFKYFPSQICTDCYEMIKLFYNFSQLCQKADNLLRKCYENTLREMKAELNVKDNSNCQTEISISEPIGNISHLKQYTVGNLNQFKSSLSLSLKKDFIESHNEKLKVLSEKINDARTLGVQTTSESVTCEDSNLVLGGKQRLKTSDELRDTKTLNCHNAMLGWRKLKRVYKYRCKKCIKSFSDVERLKLHYRVSHKVSESDVTEDCSKVVKNDKKNFFCFNCVPSKQFQTQNQLAEHLEEYHKEESKNVGTVYCCVLCTYKTFSSRLSLNEHLINVHKLKESDITWSDMESQTPELYFCMREQKSKNHNLNNSMQEDLDDDEKADSSAWNCPECPATYSRKQSLHCHMREKHNHVNPGATKCPECSESFLTNRRLIQHGIKVHQKYFALFHHVFKKVLQPSQEVNREKTFECDICRRKYIYKTSLRKHILAAHLGRSGQNAVSCTYCGKTLSNRLNLKSHIEFVHEALFVSCPICKKKINFRTIGRHYKTHSTNADLFPENNHLCNLCGKVLKTKRSFEDHQKLHQNIRDEVCDVCGNGFTTKKLLRLHKKTHEGVARKMFPCDQCEKVFSGRHTLSRHLLTHSGKKNFICEICSKCFYTIQELNRHVRYHKKDYKFDCQICDMRFLCKSSFRHHMMKHRNVRPHKCQFCEKMFIQRAKMNLHMAAKHNVEVHNTKTVWKDPKTYVPLDELL